VTTSDILYVEWFDPSSKLRNSGVTSVGFIGKQIVGFNQFVVGDLVSVVFAHNNVLRDKYESVRRSRRAITSDHQQRVLGHLQPNWSFVGPWRIVEVSKDGTLGITLRIDQEWADIRVRPDQLKPYEDK
jgi:hypothetical protein